MASSNNNVSADANSFACSDPDAKKKDDDDSDHRPAGTSDTDMMQSFSSAKPSSLTNPLRSSGINSLINDSSSSTHDFSSRILSTSISTSTVSSLLSSQSPSSTFGIASAQFQIGSPTGAFAQKKKPVKPKKDGPLFPLVGTSQKRSFFPGRPRPRSRKTQLGFGMSPKPFANLQASLSGEPTTPEIQPTNIPSAASLTTSDTPSTEGLNSPGTEADKVSSDVPFDTQDSDNSLSSMSLSFEKCIGDESYSEQWPGRMCSFCNLSEKSVLGQGELTRFDPTPGFNVFKKNLSSKVRRGSMDGELLSGPTICDRPDGGYNSRPAYSIKRREKGTGRKDKSKAAKSFFEHPEEKCVEVFQAVPIDELSHVGFIEEPDVGFLFESGGHTLAHHCCAAWSDGVCQTEDYVLVNVDKAVFAGMTQKCSSCGHFGATIRCRVSKCNKIFHYPCAATSNCFQDIKTMSLLCPEHLLEAPAVAGTEAQCVVCDSPGSIAEQLFCTSCGHHYHGPCLDPPVDVNPTVRAGWQCPDCKICQTCRKPGDDNKMMMCDTCDKGYHIFCLKPAMSSVPKHGWKCKNCRKCMDCGARTPGAGPSSRWHKNYSVCDGCYQQRNKGLACPICHRAYRYFSSKEMLQCTQCKKCIHLECDPASRNLDKAEYICPLCVGSSQELELYKDGGSSKDSMFLSHDSNHSLNEDSTSSIDTDIQGSQQSSIGLMLLDDDGKMSGRSSVSDNEFKYSQFSGKFPGKKKLSLARQKSNSKFPGKKRPKTADITRRRYTKNKFKSAIFGSSSGYDSNQNQDDDEISGDNKFILCSADDEFVLSQDVCVMCGSFGKDLEGNLIACAQCGQCYHPYCVNVKVTNVVLTKGWRCLDCTVCEGCGHPHDEARLILCDECDISYHIYCLDPPLSTVPQGTWKCKWCVVCLECGATTPGARCQWQNNYTLCGPCASHITCPICNVNYVESDLILQCLHCDRWVHGKCDQVATVEQAEKASDCGYSCMLCRPRGLLPIHLLCPPSPPPKSEPVVRPPSPLKLKELELMKPKPPVEYVIDGVILSEQGMHQIKQLQLNLPKKQRMRKNKLPQTATTPTSSTPSLSESTEDVEVIKALPSDSLPPSESTAGDVDVKTEGDDDYTSSSVFPPLEEGATIKIAEDGTVVPPPVVAEKKKRVRNLQKLGIGGFVAKPRRSLGSKEGIGEKLEPQSGLEVSEGQVSLMEGGSLLATTPEGEKPKRKRKPKKTKNPVAENYPSYLQEAFFGKDLLVTSKEQEPVLNEETDEEPSDIAVQMNKISADKTIALNAEPELSDSSVPEAKTKKLSTSESNEKISSSPKMMDDEDLGDGEAFRDILPLPQDLPQDDELMNMLMNEGDDLAKNEDPLVAIASSVESENLNTTVETADQTSSQTQISQDESSQPADDNKDDLVELLGPSFNLDAIDTGFPQMDSKDVEDVFKGVLSPDSSAAITQPVIADRPSQNVLPTSTTPSVHMPVPPQHPMPPHMNPGPPLVPPPPQQQQPSPNATNPIVRQEPTFLQPHHNPFTPSPDFSSSPQFEQMPPSPWTPTEQVEPDGQQNLTYNQRNFLKSESDEMLGNMATKAPVLYANLNHPELKLEHPNWSDRAKHVAKIWRSLSAEQKQPYLQKARENRAASRISKQQADLNKSSGVKTPKETEQEKQWKQLQALRQQQLQQQQQQMLQESSGQFDVPNSPSTPQAENMPVGFGAQVPPVAPQLPLHGNIIQVSRVRPPGDNFSQMPRVSQIQSPRMPPRAGMINPPNQRPQNMFIHPQAIARPPRAFAQHPDLFAQQQQQQQQQQRMPVHPNAFPHRIRSPVANDPYSQSPGTPMPDMSSNSVSSQDSINQLPAKLCSPLPPDATGMAAGGSPRPQLNLARTQSDPGTFNQPPASPAPTAPQQLPADPYAQPPNTPRPQASPGPFVARDPFAQSGVINRPQMSPDPYKQSPRTPRMVVPQDPYAQSPRTPMPNMSPDPYSQPPSTPRPADSFTQAPQRPQRPNQLQRSTFSPQPSLSRVNSQTESSVGDSFSPNNHGWSPNSLPQTSMTQTMSVSRDTENQEQASSEPKGNLVPSTVESFNSMNVNGANRLGPAGAASSVRSPVPVNAGKAPLDQNALQQQFLRARMAQQQAELAAGKDLNTVNNEAARNQLRDLLQKQQNQRIQDLNKPQPEGPNQVIASDQQINTISTASQQMSQARMQMRVATPDGAFRQPFPPQVRIRMSPQQAWSAQGQLVVRQSGNVQIRMPNAQQHQQMRYQIRGNAPVPSSSANNPLDPYDHIVKQRAMQQVQSGKENPAQTTVDKPMAVARPPSDIQQNLMPPQNVPPQSLNPSRPPVPGSGPLLSGPTETQLLNPEDELDDDELLGLGNDFNILEYADPELDNVLSGNGDKSNILDEQLDLDEKDEAQNKAKVKLEQAEAVTTGKESTNLQPKLAKGDAVMDSSKIKTESSASLDVNAPGGSQSCEIKSHHPTSENPAPEVATENFVVQAGPANTDVNPSLPPPPPYQALGGLQKPQKDVVPNTMQQQKVGSILQNQPLLLEDLLEQEKKEQRQNQNIGLIEEEPLLSDHDFEKLKADVLGSNPAQMNIPVSDSSMAPITHINPRMAMSPRLRGPTTVMMAQRRFQPPNSPIAASMPDWQAQQQMRFQNPALRGMAMPAMRMHSVSPMQSPTHPPQTHPPNMPPMMHAGMGRMPDHQNPAVLRSPGPSHGLNPPYQSTNIPSPTVPPLDPQNETERQQKLQYEQWLYQQQQVISIQQKYFETEIAKFRKAKKSLSTKQRQLRKNGSELNDHDAMELERIVREQAPIQKRLDQIRKHSRQHAQVYQEYSNKQIKHQQHMMAAGGNAPPAAVAQPQPMMQSPAMMSSHSPMPQGAPGTPQSPLMSPSPHGTSVQSPIMQPSPAPAMKSPVPMSPSSMVQLSPHGHPLASPVRIQAPQQQQQQQQQPDAARFHMAQDENNPFSENFQKREQVEKVRAYQRWMLEQQNSQAHGDIRQRMPLQGPRPDLSNLQKGHPFGMKPSSPYPPASGKQISESGENVLSPAGGSRPGSATPSAGQAMSPFAFGTQISSQDSARSQTPHSSAGGSRASTPRSLIGVQDIGHITSPRVSSDAASPHFSPDHGQVLPGDHIAGPSFGSKNLTSQGNVIINQDCREKDQGLPNQTDMGSTHCSDSGDSMVGNTPRTGSLSNLNMQQSVTSMQTFSNPGTPHNIDRSPRGNSSPMTNHVPNIANPSDSNFSPGSENSNRMNSPVILQNPSNSPRAISPGGHGAGVPRSQGNLQFNNPMTAFGQQPMTTSQAPNQQSYGNSFNQNFRPNTVPHPFNQGNFRNQNPPPGNPRFGNLPRGHPGKPMNMGQIPNQGNVPHPRNAGMPLSPRGFQQNAGKPLAVRNPMQGSSFLPQGSLQQQLSANVPPSSSPNRLMQPRSQISAHVTNSPGKSSHQGMSFNTATYAPVSSSNSYRLSHPNNAGNYGKPSGMNVHPGTPQSPRNVNFSQAQMSSGMNAGSPGNQFSQGQMRSPARSPVNQGNFVGQTDSHLNSGNNSTNQFRNMSEGKVIMNPHTSTGDLGVLQSQESIEQSQSTGIDGMSTKNRENNNPGQMANSGHAQDPVNRDISGLVASPNSERVPESIHYSHNPNNPHNVNSYMQSDLRNADMQNPGNHSPRNLLGDNKPSPSNCPDNTILSATPYTPSIPGNPVCALNESGDPHNPRNPNNPGNNNFSGNHHYLGNQINARNFHNLENPRNPRLPYNVGNPKNPANMNPFFNVQQPKNSTNTSNTQNPGNVNPNSPRIPLNPQFPNYPADPSNPGNINPGHHNNPVIPAKPENPNDTASRQEPKNSNEPFSRGNYTVPGSRQEPGSMSNSGNSLNPENTNNPAHPRDPGTIYNIRNSQNSINPLDSGNLNLGHQMNPENSDISANPQEENQMTRPQALGNILNPDVSNNLTNPRDLDNFQGPEVLNNQAGPRDPRNIQNPEVLNNPTGPRDPGNIQNPEVSNNPVGPRDPGNIQNPEVSNNPIGPRDPGNIQNPEILNNPTGPRDPGNIQNPEISNNPIGPRDPGNIQNPEVSNNPAGPRDPGNIQNPEVSNNPIGPRDPGNIQNPEVSNNPIGPRDPGNIQHPEVLNNPTGPRDPGNIQNPEVSNNPVGPRDPGNIQNPEVLNNPTGPRDPGNIQNPEVSNNPIGPRDPGNIQNPEVLNSPTGPRDPGNIQNPEASNDPIGPRDPGNIQNPEISNNSAGLRDPGNIQNPQVSNNPTGPRDPGNIQNPEVSNSPVRPRDPGNIQDPVLMGNSAFPQDILNPEDPNYHARPGDPGNIKNVEVHNNPATPHNLGNISNLEKPSDPGNIYNPERPRDPGNIQKPAVLSNSSRPRDPGNIGNPERPQDPGNIYNPERPRDPGNIQSSEALSNFSRPQNSGSVKHSDVPVNPLKPQDPGNIYNPERPRDPGNIKSFEGPHNPARPRDPGNINNAEKPRNPGNIYNPERPRDPGNIYNPVKPRDPGNIHNPERPRDPGNIYNPERPRDPGNIQKPAVPSNPEKPRDPGNIYNPERPRDPGNIGHPERSQDPGNIYNPERPRDPGNIGNPERPQDPGNIYNPERPRDPGNIQKPADPSNSSRPQNSGNMVHSNAPINPEKPRDPGNIYNPERPRDPGNIGNPERPQDPGNIYNPERPRDPGNIGNPERPQDPGNIYNPERPRDPGNIQKPADPSNSSRPQNSGNMVHSNAPINPEKPRDPGNIYNPERPRDPGNIGNPERPRDPGNIQRPEVPSNSSRWQNMEHSDVPVNPLKPQDPGNIKSFEVPKNPAGPQDPGNIQNSEAPSHSSKPQNSGNIYNPERPRDPGNIESFEVPNNPARPRDPGNIDNPESSRGPDNITGFEVPKNPSSPFDPENMSNSERPQDPGYIYNPPRPRDPGNIKNLEVSDNPAIPPYTRNIGNPERPRDPDNIHNSERPRHPGNIQNQEGPSSPSKPQNCGNSEQSEVPSNSLKSPHPGNIYNPERPRDPGNIKNLDLPNNPTQHHNPETLGDCGSSQYPEISSNPSTPQNSANIENPINPLKPQDPGNIYNPERPRDPGNIKTLEVPNKHARPLDLGNSSNRERPEDPGNIHNPERPRDPGNIYNPERPRDPGNINNPSGPRDPGNIHGPEETRGNTQNPELSKNVVSPPDPENIQNFERPRDPGNIYNPERPRDPGNINNPAGPRDPGNIHSPEGTQGQGSTQNPEHSKNVVNPPNPENIQNFERPRDPGNIYNPERPRDPGNINNPSGPRDPGNIHSPEGTQGQGSTQNPEHSKNVVNPPNPENIQNFERPRDPGNIYNPERPRDPGNINNPSGPRDPGNIHSPEGTRGQGNTQNPEHSKNVVNPENIQNFERPQDPGNIYNPERPRDPGNINNPAGPRDPGNIHSPEGTRGQGNTQNPEHSKNVVNPENIQNFERPRDPGNIYNPERPRDPGNINNPAGPRDPGNIHSPEGAREQGNTPNPEHSKNVNPPNPENIQNFERPRDPGNINNPSGPQNPGNIHGPEGTQGDTHNQELSKNVVNPPDSENIQNFERPRDPGNIYNPERPRDPGNINNPSGPQNPGNIHGRPEGTQGDTQNQELSKNVVNPPNSENVQNFERPQDPGNIQNFERPRNPGNIQDFERPRDPGNIQNPEVANNPAGPQDPGNIQNSQASNNTSRPQDPGNINNLGRVQNASSTQNPEVPNSQSTSSALDTHPNPQVSRNSATPCDSGSIQNPETLKNLPNTSENIPSNPEFSNHPLVPRNPGNLHNPEALNIPAGPQDSEAQKNPANPSGPARFNIPENPHNPANALRSNIPDGLNFSGGAFGVRRDSIDHGNPFVERQPNTRGGDIPGNLPHPNNPVDPLNPGKSDIKEDAENLNNLGSSLDGAAGPQSAGNRNNQSTSRSVGNEQNPGDNPVVPCKPNPADNAGNPQNQSNFENRGNHGGYGNPGNLRHGSEKGNLEIPNSLQSSSSQNIDSKKVGAHVNPSQNLSRVSNQPTTNPIKSGERNTSHYQKPPLGTDRKETPGAAQSSQNSDVGKPIAFKGNALPLDSNWSTAIESREIKSENIVKDEAPDAKTIASSSMSPFQGNQWKPLIKIENQMPSHDTSCIPPSKTESQSPNLGNVNQSVSGDGSNVQNLAMSNVSDFVKSQQPNEGSAGGSGPTSGLQSEQSKVPTVSAADQKITEMKFARQQVAPPSISEQSSVDIQSETLPVSNTVQFTLRQTGMPPLGPAQASLFGSPLSTNNGSNIPPNIPSPRSGPVSQAAVVPQSPNASTSGQLPLRSFPPSVAGPRPGTNIRQVPPSIINEMMRRGIPVTSETVTQVLNEIQLKASNAQRSQVQTISAPLVTTSDQATGPGPSSRPPIYTPAQINDMIHRRQPIPQHIIRDILSRGLSVTSATISSFANAAHMPPSVPKVSQVGIPSNLVPASVPSTVEQKKQSQVLELKVETSVPSTCSAPTTTPTQSDQHTDDQKPGDSKMLSDPQNVLLKHLLQSDSEKADVKNVDPNAPQTPPLNKDLSPMEEDMKTVHPLQTFPPQNPGQPHLMDSSALNDQNKGKRKRNQSKSGTPRQKKDKEGLSGPAKKRSKKMSKPEPDYDTFISNLISELRRLPVLVILEPDIPPDFNSVPVFGSGNMNASESRLKGTCGNALLPGQPEYYSCYPFGNDPPTPPVSLPPTPPPHRGFYNQEFPSYKGDDLKYNVLPHGRQSVDVPSFPTPPPTRDANSPDTVLSSSSPECFLFEPVAKYPGLQLIDDDSDDVFFGRKSISPNIPLLAPIPIKAIRALTEIHDDKNKENIGNDPLVKPRIGTSPHSGPLKETGNIGVTLTLSATAAEDIRGVLNSLADLLKIAAPASYKIIERTTTPPSQRLGLYKKDKELSTSIQSVLNGKPSFCRHCDIVVLSAGIKKKVSELPSLARDDLEDAEVIFCSTNCYMQFAITHRANPCQEREAAAVVSHLSDIFGPIQPKKKDADKQEGDNVSDEKMEVDDPKMSTDSAPNTSEIKSSAGVQPTVSETPPQESSELDNKENAVASVTCTDKVSSPPRMKHPSSSSKLQAPPAKRWRDIRWRKWMNTFVPKTTPQPSSFNVDEALNSLDICVKPETVQEDTRKCELCQELGDGPAEGTSRMLNSEINTWVHLNCALWSSDVYETVNGALMNVQMTCKRGMSAECVVCHRKGATVTCFKFRCTNVYHFSCAQKDKCVFYKDKSVLCQLHAPKIPQPDTELTSFAVTRRVYINREENQQVAKVVQNGLEQDVIRIGSLIFLSVGQLLPHQLQAFHTPNCIYPIGYKVIRMYWGMRIATKRCQYLCSIHDAGGKPEFRIVAQEPGHEEVSFVDATTKGVWMQVIERVIKLRKDLNAIKVFSNFISGDDLFGLTEPVILRIIESLPGVDMLSNYNFRYGRSPVLELPLAINPTGCARTEPKMRTHVKRPHTLHTRTSSRPAFQSTVTGFEVACPYTKQFVHSKSSQYRKMKMEWRNNIYLARSKIQGLGLYAARDIEKHTMVIEYIGQLIRNEVAESNERIYESQNRGVYMFRLDENKVIDATLSGGLARYVNHSCNPNCVTETVQIDRENKILIIANTRIPRGVELCYDYKFDMEDDQHKIPCMCGAPNCRKWMN